MNTFTSARESGCFLGLIHHKIIKCKNIEDLLSNYMVLHFYKQYARNTDVQLSIPRWSMLFLLCVLWFKWYLSRKTCCQLSNLLPEKIKEAISLKQKKTLQRVKWWVMGSDWRWHLSAAYLIEYWWTFKMYGELWTVADDETLNYIAHDMLYPLNRFGVPVGPEKLWRYFTKEILLTVLKWFQKVVHDGSTFHLNWPPI